MIQPKYITHPNRPTLARPESFHEKREIPVEDRSAAAAIIHLSDTVHTVTDEKGPFEAAESIQDTKKGNI